MKVYAYFLPQFYSTPENDKYWGKGFTEWRNVRNAEPLFKGHNCPLLPVDSDYYNLSKPDTVKRVLQNTVDIGLDGIVYWHYWFWKGKRTLEKVPEVHLNDKEISQKYFFAWGNADWTRSWIGKDKEIIFKQHYRLEDVEAHIQELLPYFEDDRYIKQDSSPLFQVNDPQKKGVKPYIMAMDEVFKRITGLKLSWVFPSFQMDNELAELQHFKIGFPPEDVQNQDNLFKRRKQLASINPWKKPVVTTIKEYTERMSLHLKENAAFSNFCPTILSGWDTTYRYQKSGNVLEGAIEDIIKEQMKVINQELSVNDVPFILIKAYNEWAEGNILENYTFEEKKYDISHVVKKVIKEGK